MRVVAPSYRRRRHTGRRNSIYRALSILDRRQESGHHCTLSVDPMAAIDRIRPDSIGPGQHLAVAATEVCDRTLG